MAIPSLDPKGRFFSQLGIIFIILALSAFSLILLPYHFPKVSFKTLGDIGSLSNGIITPIIGIAAAILTFMAFYVQYLANFAFHNQFKTQQFESQFYEMLRLHKENINEMKIIGYDRNEVKTYKDNEEILREVSKVERITEGRKVFVTMYTELIASIKLVKRLNSRFNSPLKNTQVFKLGYQFFFYGSNSNSVKVAGISENTVKAFARHLNLIRKRHSDSLGDVNRFGLGYDGTIKLYIKYKPFSGHESRLGHYYRHLFNTVEYVVNQDIFSYEEKRKYLKMLRSQMSNDEHLLLYYNYLIGFGKEWGKMEYLTKYRMLKNLPIERVELVENPRIHFSNFIKNIDVENKDRMFERGDYEKEVN